MMNMKDIPMGSGLPKVRKSRNKADDIRKRRTYKFWGDLELFLESCPNNKKMLKKVYELLDNTYAFHSQKNADYNLIALKQVIKDSGVYADRHGQ